MYTIYAEFQRFRDVNLVDLIGATGVYVIWDARAKARPTYIGEGNILKRFTDHVKRDNRRFAHPWNGYVAIIAGSTRDVHKYESTVVERLLLDVAKETDRQLIWDARAKARPTYIGEGNILKRFSEHVRRDGRRFAHPWNGYVAIIAGSTRDVHKSESTVVERLILDVAKDTRGGSFSKACCFIFKSASMYTWVVSMLSWPSQSAITAMSTPD